MQVISERNRRNEVYALLDYPGVSYFPHYACQLIDGVGVEEGRLMIKRPNRLFVRGPHVK